MKQSRFVKAYLKLGSLRAVSQEHNLTYYQARELYRKAVLDGKLEQRGQEHRTKKRPEKEPVMTGSVKPSSSIDWRTQGERNVFILTAAQNNTTVHKEFLRNLLAYAEHRDGGLSVARYTYIKHNLNKAGEKASSENEISGSNAVVWDPAILKYAVDERVRLADDLYFCGEMNISPTAVRPLSGLEVYTSTDSAIFPHPKIAMESIPTAQGAPTKFNYTTGTVTHVNYLQKKTGLKAQFHHCYGALVVEVDEYGEWFVRQINAKSDGSFQDLGWFVEDGQVHEDNPVFAINWGDIHAEEMDSTVMEVNWGEHGILDSLRPDYQFMHDLIDFGRRSHHNIKDPYEMMLQHTTENESMEDAVSHAGWFIDTMVIRGDVLTVIVHSNHDDHLMRWLKEQNGLKDPVNAQFWLNTNKRMIDYIVDNGHSVHSPLSIVLEDWVTPRTMFLGVDESYVLNGIEFGMHGHAGPNGSRGNPATLARCGMRANIGHTHKAGIVDGVYVAGTCGPLDSDWTHGPGAWSWSHIVTYPNGKRAIITMRPNGAWRMEAEDGEHKDS